MVKRSRASREDFTLHQLFKAVDDFEYVRDLVNLYLDQPDKEERYLILKDIIELLGDIYEKVHN